MMTSYEIMSYVIMITSYLVDVGSYKVIQFVQNSINDFNQQMTLLVLCGRKFSNTGTPLKSILRNPS